MIKFIKVFQPSFTYSHFTLPAYFRLLLINQTKIEKER